MPARPTRSFCLTRFCLATASVAALGLAAPGIAHAQILSGQVTDVTGQAPFEGAVVTLDETGRSATTDRFGRYRLSNLQPGTYDVTVTYLGTLPQTQTITIPASGASLDFLIGDNVRYEDNVIVVGTRAAQANALNQQRASNSIINVIDSDGLGYFPDTTVADSLSRVVGLSIETDQGEGRYVSIRGINTDLISASINGVRTPSPEDRRGVLLDGVPSDLLDGIEVQKSLTPDVDGDSLGGVINLKTISAFDRRGQFLRAKLEGRYNDITDVVSPKATLTYSNVFNDRLGIAISGNYQDLDIESHNNESGGWGTEGGTDFFLNDDYEQRWYDIDRERIGLVANIDFEASDSTRLYLRTLYNRYSDDEVRNKFELKDLDDGAATSATTSSVPLNEVDVEVRQREEIRRIETYALGGETLTGPWAIDYEVAYAFAEEDDSDNHDATFRFENIQDRFPGTVAFDTSNPETPVLSGGATLAAIYDPANYLLDTFEREFTVNKDTEYSGKINVARDSLWGDTPVEWKGGLKFRDREKVRDANLTFQENDALNLSAFTNERLIDGWRLPNAMPAFPDPDLTAALRANPNGLLELNTGDTNFESLAEDFTIDESVFAGYAMGTFDLGSATIIAGARVEHTEVDMVGNNFVEGSDPSTVTVLTFDQSYTDVLPSVNLRYDFSDRLLGRAAYYKAVVRPSFGQMAPFARFSDDFEDAQIGNPDLDPYSADNFDLALEFYPNDVSVYSVGAFYKRIEDPIFDAVFDADDVPANIDISYFTAEQLAELEELTVAINTGSADIYGVEFNVVQDLASFIEALDGFLLTANLTLTDSESEIPDGDDIRTVPFLKQSDTVFNAALAYDKGPWDLRASLNYRGDFLDELISEGGPGDAEFGALDRYTDGRWLLEASAKYRVNDSLQLYVEGKNLTDAPEYYYFGSERRLSQYDEFGRTYVFGLRYTY
ncbi:TonB-dependent receptor [uncultured Algimonas sp.]|uniref:TonB-dependent receptor n=1 Tax=uncultured Algimonas sp. TaxID=1547920 RepID=UPI002614E976|nr:TonB-dependent receptor [uncultured Algimonas sp.]